MKRNRRCPFCDTKLVFDTSKGEMVYKKKDGLVWMHTKCKKSLDKLSREINKTTS